MASIKVKGYTRSDGVKVKGYTRKVVNGRRPKPGTSRHKTMTKRKTKKSTSHKSRKGKGSYKNYKK